jgi:hypothetical protein
MKASIDNIFGKNEKIIITIDDNKYEFIINKQEAIVEFLDNKYIIDATKIVKNMYPHIYKFHSKDNSYYEEFDQVYSFKLPINIIQPSKFFLNKDLILKIDENINPENIYLPVSIINDEYVLLDGHHRLYALNENYIKMVNVYIKEYSKEIPDYVYIAKEGNIKNISQLHVLEKDEYEKYWNEFLKQFEF